MERRVPLSAEGGPGAAAYPRPRRQKNLRHTREFMVEIPAEKAKANPKERVEFTIVRPRRTPRARARTAPSCTRSWAAPRAEPRGRT